MKNTITLLLFIFLANLIYAQDPELRIVDSLVYDALLHSEEKLYRAQFNEAKEIVQLDHFNKLIGYKVHHEIMLTIQNQRVGYFMSNVYQQKFDHAKNLERLERLLPDVQIIKDKNVQGEYFMALSGAYRSSGNMDSLFIYENKAANLFQETQDFQKLAILRATRISWKHSQFLNDVKKEEILALIPEYKEEIEFSTNHSKYALSYNTRHLAQIHRRQTLNYEEALKLFQASLSIREEIGFKPYLPASYSSIGDVYAKMGKFDCAIDMYLRAASFADEIGFIRYQSIPILNIGDCYLIQNNKEKALEYYKKSIRIATENNYEPGVLQAEEKINNIEVNY